MDGVNADAKGGFCRIEIVTGPERRRRWSASEKAQIVAEMLSPGGGSGTDELRAARAGDGRHSAPRGEAQHAVPEPERSGKTAAASSIEIKLAGAVVRVASGMDAALLAEVLRAIRASAA